MRLEGLVLPTFDFEFDTLFQSSARGYGEEQYLVYQPFLADFQPLALLVSYDLATNFGSLKNNGGTFFQSVQISHTMEANPYSVALSARLGERR